MLYPSQEARATSLDFVNGQTCRHFAVGAEATAIRR